MAELVRFVHAADLHLDAPFKGVDAADPRVRDALVASTYDAFAAVVELCIARSVDFLVLAGDVYNQAEKQLRAEFAFRAACERLAEAGVEIFVARGNHDPASGFTAGLRLPDNVHFFSEREVERVAFLRDGREVCALYGRSFRTSAETSNFAAGYKREKDDALAVAVLHTNVGGRAGYEPYAPCTLEELKAARMDYWALGHIHKPEVLCDSPAVVYAGSTQGLDPNDTGVRGCNVVTLGDGGAQVEFVPTSAVVWGSAAISLEDAESIDDVRQLALRAVDGASAEAEGRPVVLRLSLEGRSAAHAPLARPGIARDLLAEVRAESLDRQPWVWVDRIADRTRPAIDLDTLRASEDFTGDLVRRADALLADQQAAEAYVAAIVAEPLGALDASDVPGVDAASVLQRAMDLALDRLLAEEGR
jgi:DNA repair exonuclease SbcCD nuclease subunit